MTINRKSLYNQQYGVFARDNAIQHSLGRTHDFGNNFCDAEYAFAASYVGRIATTDSGLTEAIRAVFPYVDILCEQRR